MTRIELKYEMENDSDGDSSSDIKHMTISTYGSVIFTLFSPALFLVFVKYCQQNISLFCEPGCEVAIVDELKTLPSVVEVARIYGSYDIIVKITSDTTGKLKEIISNNIRDPLSNTDNDGNREERQEELEKGLLSPLLMLAL